MVGICFDELICFVIRAFVRECRTFDDVEISEVALKVWLQML